MQSLLSKSYIDDRNNVYYDVDLQADPGRPNSLRNRPETFNSHLGVPGSYTDQNHWIFWFNDYLQTVKRFDSANSSADNYGGARDNDNINNKIIMFKSGFTTNNIIADKPNGRAANPFIAGWHVSNNATIYDATIDDYKAVYTRLSGVSYTNNGYTYLPLDEVFANNPDYLFIVITAPPWKIGGSTNANAHRARLFANWLTNEWVAGYNSKNPGLRNVAVFNYFNLLAAPEQSNWSSDSTGTQNRLKEEYGGKVNVHPLAIAHNNVTSVFATNSDNFLDRAWSSFQNSVLPTASPTKTATPSPTQTPTPYATPTLSPSPTPISPTSAIVPGDANNDGLVNEIDFGTWRNHYDSPSTNGHQDGDFNNNGFVDGVDYVIWLRHVTN